MCVAFSTRKNQNEVELLSHEIYQKHLKLCRDYLKLMISFALKIREDVNFDIHLLRYLHRESLRIVLIGLFLKLRL